MRRIYKWFYLVHLESKNVLMKTPISFFACSLLYSLGALAQPVFIRDSLDIYVEREMRRWNIPGAAVAVIKDGKAVVMKGYGIRETGKPGKVDENTLFQVASNSKAFTGTSLALLHVQKRMSLDDKVTKWLPYFKLHDELATREATVRDLLCHRIGFETFQSDLLNWNCNLSRKELIANMRNVKPVYSFRAKYGYCNAGFLAAGEVIPAVTDTSWDDFLKHRFFVPLKMNRTTTTYKGIIEDQNACKPYTLVDGKLVLLPYANIDNIGPAASINSSIKDLANWLQMNLDSGMFEGKRIVPYEALQFATASNMLVRDMPPASGATFQTYGLGWFILDYHGKRVIRHDGGADGFVTTTCFVPSMNLGIVVLTNTDANNFYSALRTQILDAYIGAPYVNQSEKIFKVVDVGTKKEAEELKKLREIAAKKPKHALNITEYAGKYKNEIYGGIEIIPSLSPKSVGTLTIKFEHHPQLTGKLEPLGENEFLCTYSIATYGVKKINFITSSPNPSSPVEGSKPPAQIIKSVIIRVNDFVDMMEYEFKKVDG